MITEKAYAICLLEILKEYSDAEHIMQMKDIQSKMEFLYGIKPDRRTVYSSVGILIDLGYDISIYDENKKGYFLRSREFETSEILLLTEAVCSFPFIPEKQSEDLILKLQNQTSCHQRKHHKHLKIVKSERKTENRQIFWNIDQIDEAISNRRKISFTYMEYGFDMQMHPRREAPYIVIPHELIYMNEHFYLVCSYKDYSPALYRIDRMKDIEVLDVKAELVEINRAQLETAVYAFSGKPEVVTMRCDIIILSDLIDKFGKEIHIIKESDDEFTAIISASPAGIKFWALQYLPYVEVVKPEWLRDEIVESIRKNKYEKTL